VPEYFGEGDRIHVIFNFFVNQYFFLALAREDARPIRMAYDALPQIPEFCQWANFLRSHDELDLGRLSDSERQEVYHAFGPKKNMRIYNRGIRRRLAPMLGNDRKRLEPAHSLLLTLPGTPILRYGDEIGMGEDLSLEERDSVRTPMQWSNANNGGFSSAPANELILPVIKGGDFGYERVNVAAQQRESGSLLNWLERATRLRRRCPEFGSGKWQWLETSDSAVLAHCCQDETSVFAIHNLSSREVNVTVDFGRKVAYLFDILTNREEKAQDNKCQRFRLRPYGYRWLRESRGPENVPGI
jgi:maltose alpha-D-glucosyltransferase/alpha-amylase